MKNEHKRAISRKKIQTAVIELLKDHELQDLKVTTICQKAHINRSSFYDNYTDIYDLTDKLRDYLVDEYEVMQKNDRSPSFLKLLQHVQANQDLYRLFFKLNLQMGLTEKFPINQPEQSYYDKIFFRNGVVAVIAEWLANNCLEPPEQIAQLIEIHRQCFDNYKKKTI